MAIAITIAETIIDTGVTVGTTVVTLDYPGPQGPQGDSGVVGVTSPITNTGTAGSANIGLNQSLLSLAREQIIGTAITTVAGKALTAGTADYATNAGTSTFATTAGTASYATTAGSADATNVLSQTVKAGTAITKGQAVYVTGATGTNVIVGLAQANTEATSSKTLGLVTTTLAANDFGTVVTDGLVTGLDTSTATAGDPVWLSPTTPGGLLFGTANKPAAPNMLVYLGVVVRAHANQGSIFVHVQNGFELDELHDVTITSAQNGEALVYNSSTHLWANGSPEYATTAGTAQYAYDADLAQSAVNAATATIAVYATDAGNANYALTSGTAAYATLSGTAVFATNAGTASYAAFAGTAGALSANITKTQVTGTAVTLADTGTVTNTMLAGSIAASKISGTAAVLSSANTFTVGGQVVKTGGDATRGIDIWRNSATQTGALLSIFQSNGTSALAQFDAKGALSLTSDTTGTVLLVSGTNTSATELVVKGPASNTGNLQEWQNSAGSVLAKVNSAGQLTAVIDGGSA